MAAVLRQRHLMWSHSVTEASTSAPTPGVATGPAAQNPHAAATDAALLGVQRHLVVAAAANMRATWWGQQQPGAHVSLARALLPWWRNELARLLHTRLQVVVWWVLPAACVQDGWQDGHKKTAWRRQQFDSLAVKLLVVMPCHAHAIQNVSETSSIPQQQFRAANAFQLWVGSPSRFAGTQ